MSRLSRPTVAVALAGGLAWVTKAIAITVLDSSFEPLESPLFVLGLVLTVSAAFLLAHDLTTRFGGVRRAATTFLVGVVICGLGMGLMNLADRLSAAWYDGDNLGIGMESGVFALGFAWVLVALGGLRRGPGQVLVPVEMEPSARV